MQVFLCDSDHPSLPSWQSSDSIQQWLPPLEMRTKWALMMFTHDSFSVEFLTGLSQMGCKVIVVTTDVQIELPQYPFLRAALPEKLGFYWIHLDMRNLDKFRSDLLATGCPALDIVWLAAVRRRDETGRAIQYFDRLFELNDNYVREFEHYLHDQVVMVHAVLALLDPLVRAAKEPKVVMHNTGLSSVSQMSNGMGLRMRVAATSVYSLIRAYSILLPHGVVVGAHLGLWWPGLREFDNMVGILSGTEAASRLMSMITQLSKNLHNGFVIDYRLEVVPP